MLVLAIAGLIFLMVFLALPALQRSQRDTQRRDDLARFTSQIAQYQTNNRGRVPKEAGLFVPNNANSKIDGENVTGSVMGEGVTESGEDWNNFLNNYMWAVSDSFTDPGGTNYAIQDMGKLDTNAKGGGTGDNVITVEDGNATLSLKTMDYVIYLWHGANCGSGEGEVIPSTSGSERKIAYVYKLEGNGYYCGEN